MKIIKFLTIIGIVSLGLLSFNTLFQEEWKVPEKYKKMKNTTASSAENVALGKSLYAKHCKSCHGKDGLGDGPKAKEVEGDLGDFSSKKFQSQSDGDMFYKSYIGRKDMPNYEKKMTSEDVWLVIHYMRMMGAKK